MGSDERWTRQQPDMTWQDDWRLLFPGNSLYSAGTGRPACLQLMPIIQVVCYCDSISSHLTLAGWLVSDSWQDRGNVPCLPLPQRRRPFVFPRHHRWSPAHCNQRACCGGQGWVPDCNVELWSACWMKIWSSINIRLIHVRLSITENIRSSILFLTTACNKCTW